MNVKITSRKFRAKDSLKEYIKEEAAALEKYAEDIIDVEVILSFEHNKDSIKTAEVIVQVPGKILTASENSEDFNKSVGFVFEKMIAQLKKIKTKRIDNNRTTNVA
ncbi:MAG TPA: ribosome-associated translation inhibitor RaiA [Ignavibacteriales bacterium]|nr:ribosome-associated translation inhibitor RaiA [Ignavibacteriales bacterium]